ncbi:MAG: 50S ribosome-binding GTPase [Methanobacterium sp.]|uniref:ADP-ribosylation factor-like protein n=1 Tax=Methanobacterium sp. TaxID=2164 RepID=UPI003D64DAB9|nr:50S ribosome-binding GTPase [Methanobacterium sp.]
MEIKEVKKIVILGTSNSGKTTALKHICSDMIKTTALDYGKTVINNKKTHFFSSPGNKRFKFMQDILCKNINGAIIFIDNTKDITKNDMEIIKFVEEKRVPFVIFANKQDISNKCLNIEFIKAPIIPTIAINGMGINHGLKILLDLIDQNETNPPLKAICSS